MAKFYVQSGTMRRVVQADSRRKAALWAVHEALQQILPMEDTATESPEAKSESVSSQGIAVLSAKVSVSERGFEGSDATSHPTL